MEDRELLQKLRDMNQNLLRRLKAKQEAFKKCVPAKPLSPLLKSGVGQNRRGPDPKGGKENQGRSAKIATATSVEAVPRVARSGCGRPSKPSTFPGERESEGSGQRRWCSDSPPAEVTLRSMATIEAPAREICKTVPIDSLPRGPRAKTVPASRTEARKHPASGRDRAGVDPGHTQADGSSRTRASTRVLQTPKSILLTPRWKESKDKTKKEAGHVSFVSDPEEYSIPADDWSVRPFLGYDWIAGLLDMDSSVSEKPEQYFSDLQDFRRVNRGACIYDRRARSATSEASILEQEPSVDLVPHQCVFCYRLNKRLFAVPTDSESACPICKTPRARRPPETLVEPAFVRVSIPRSTLLPAYKHKIHRRKSYEPGDNLALPSHCLAGWENPIQGFSSTLNSLDLRSSLASKPPSRAHSKSRSRVSGGTRTDELLDLSRAAEFELGSVSRLWDRHKPPGCKATSN